MTDEQMNMTIWVVSKEVMEIDSDGYEFVKVDEFDSAFSTKELAEKYVKQQESYGRKGYGIEEILVDEYVKKENSRQK